MDTDVRASVNRVVDVPDEFAAPGGATKVACRVHEFVHCSTGLETRARFSRLNHYLRTARWDHYRDDSQPLSTLNGAGRAEQGRGWERPPVSR